MMAGLTDHGLLESTILTHTRLSVIDREAFVADLGSEPHSLEVPIRAGSVVVNLQGTQGFIDDIRATGVAVASGRAIATVVPAADGTAQLDPPGPMTLGGQVLGYFLQ